MNWNLETESLKKKIQHFFQSPLQFPLQNGGGAQPHPTWSIGRGMDFLRIPTHALTTLRTCELPGSSAWVQLPDPWSTATQLEDCAGALEQGVIGPDGLLVGWLVGGLFENVVFLQRFMVTFFWGGISDHREMIRKLISKGLFTVHTM